MYPILFHLSGSFAIHSYGAAIISGITLALLVARYDNWIKKTGLWNYCESIIFLLIASALSGGRLLFFLSSKTLSLQEFFFVWDGGFSILGAITGGLVGLVIFALMKKISALILLDAVAVYASLVQAVSRIGCFLAGCCYGAPILGQKLWGVIYLNSKCMAPLGVKIHPVQLYSALCLLSIFIFLFTLRWNLSKRPGVLAALYLFLVVIERLLLDFWRWEKTFWSKDSYFLFDHTSAYLLLITSLMALLFNKRLQRTPNL